MSSRRRRRSPSPPSPSYSDGDEVDQYEMQRQWLAENHPNVNGDVEEHPPNNFIFLTPESYRLEQERLQQHPAPGVAYHVHNVFDNIKENTDEILKTLGGPHLDLFFFRIGPEELLFGFHGCCAQILQKHYTSPLLEIEMDKLRQITTKIHFAREEFLDHENISNIFTAIQFVMRQPDVFQKYYVDLFIEDTFYAYDLPVGHTESAEPPPPLISCPKGIVERMLFAIADACLLYCTSWKKKLKQKKNRTRKKRKISGGVKFQSQYKRCTNPVYRTLIRLFKKEVPDINVLTSEWALILEDKDVVDAMTADDLKMHFIKFMKDKYESYGLTQTDKIMERANQFEELQVFTRKAF